MNTRRPSASIRRVRVCGRPGTIWLAARKSVARVRGTITAALLGVVNVGSILDCVGGLLDRGQGG